MKRPPPYQIPEEGLYAFPRYQKYLNGRELILIHINKTGGTGLRQAFGLPAESVWRGSFRKHYSYTDLVQCMPDIDRFGYQFDA